MENKLYWHTLNHPTAQLFIEERPEGSNRFHAWFTNMTQHDILPLTAMGLRRENRFANQLHHPVSVLQHTVWLGWFLLHSGIERNVDGCLVNQALFHDTPEAFALGDLPSHIKSPHDQAREDAVYEAFNWPDIILTNEEERTFKFWDGIAGAAEAYKYGCYVWPWMPKVKAAHPKELESYLDFLGDFSTNQDQLERTWLNHARRFCERGGTINHVYPKHDSDYPINIPVH